ncbi:MAG: hypothetical protein JWO53_251, partial [Chlamydiia bacterium]|nr:hypothetical protein [Chlamydiia bacterium]
MSAISEKERIVIEQQVQQNTSKQDSSLDITAVALTALPSSSSTHSTTNRESIKVRSLQRRLSDEYLTYDTISLKSTELTETEKGTLKDCGLLEELEELEKDVDVRAIARIVKAKRESKEKSAAFFKFILGTATNSLKKIQATCLFNLNKIDIISYVAFITDSIRNDFINFSKNKIGITHNSSTNYRDMLLIMEQTLTGGQEKQLPYLLKQMQTVASTQVTGETRSLLDKAICDLHYLSLNRPLLCNILNIPQKIINAMNDFLGELDYFYNFHSETDSTNYTLEILKTLEKYEKLFTCHYTKFVTEYYENPTFRKIETILNESPECINNREILKEEAKLILRAYFSFIASYGLLFDKWSSITRDLKSLSVEIFSTITAAKHIHQKKLNTLLLKSQFSSSQKKKINRTLTTPQSEEKGLEKDVDIESLTRAMQAAQITSSKLSERVQEDSQPNQFAMAAVQENIKKWITIQSQSTRLIKAPELKITIPNLGSTKILYHKRILRCFSEATSQPIHDQEGHTFAFAVDSIAFEHGEKVISKLNGRVEIKIEIPAITTTRTGDKVKMAFTYTMAINENRGKALLYHRCHMLSTQDFSKRYSTEIVQSLQ